MQISSKDFFHLIILVSVIFLIAPTFLIAYVIISNRRKKKHFEEKELLQKDYESKLLRNQVEVQEQTLQAVAYDLHDHIGQILSLTAMTLGSVDLDDTSRLADKINHAEDLAKRCIQELRGLSRLFHGEELLSKGLVKAIEFELEWIKRSVNFSIVFAADGFATAPDAKDKEIVIFRLFQEILNNAVKHSKATEVSVNLLNVGQCALLTIADNGIGFNLAEILGKRKGMGLHNIQKRAELLNGRAEINSELGKGTLINIYVPL
jgi:signal transduction histidine kinase